MEPAVWTLIPGDNAYTLYPCPVIAAKWYIGERQFGIAAKTDGRDVAREQRWRSDIDAFVRVYKRTWLLHFKKLRYMATNLLTRNLFQ